jgi:hypothetical protein
MRFYAVSTLSKIAVCVVAVLCVVALELPSLAEDDQFSKIAAMDMDGLEKFVGVVTAGVGQDTLKLRGAADRGDCLELYRAGNAFDLGYRYLAKVNELIADKRDARGLSLRTRVVQSRVVVFAARVRAEEFIGQTCSAFTIPDDKAEDMQFAVPAKIALADFTGAVIEAREAAEVIYLGATEAAKSKKCGPIGTVIQAIQLLAPYLEKLSRDVADRPQALGPRASRAALIQSRVRLINAANQLDAGFGQSCSMPAPTESPATPAPSGQ